MVALTTEEHAETLISSLKHDFYDSESTSSDCKLLVFNSQPGMGAVIIQWVAMPAHIRNPKAAPSFLYCVLCIIIIKKALCWSFVFIWQWCTYSLHEALLKFKLILWFYMERRGGRKGLSRPISPTPPLHGAKKNLKFDKWMLWQLNPVILHQSNKKQPARPKIM